MSIVEVPRSVNQEWFCPHTGIYDLLQYFRQYTDIASVIYFKYIKTVRKTLTMSGELTVASGVSSWFVL